MLKIETFSVAPLESNCYVLTDEQSGLAAVIDPGYPDGAGFERALNAGDKLKYILLTHRHFDHVLGAAALKRLTGAKIAVGRLDACGVSSAQASMFTDFSMYYDIEQELTQADVLLDEGDEIALGSSKFTVLHTPGHTEGSVCFVCGDDIFTGDTLFCGSMGRVDFDTGDIRQMAQSLARLAKLDGSMRVYPGHDSATTIERERKFNEYMKRAENGTLYY